MSTQPPIDDPAGLIGVIAFDETHFRLARRDLKHLHRCVIGDAHGAARADKAVYFIVVTGGKSADQLRQGFFVNRYKDRLLTFDV